MRIHSSQSYAVLSPVLSHITVSSLLHKPICSYTGGVQLCKSPRRNYPKMTANEQTCLSVIILIESISLPGTTDALTIWRRQQNLPLVVRRSREPAVAVWENAATYSTFSKMQHRDKDSLQPWKQSRETEQQTERKRDGRQCSLQADMQLFYLQRRHDIPCPLKPATERCSPCSCCWRPSLTNTSRAKRGAAGNPIGLTGTLPNSGKCRHWVRSAEEGETRVQGQRESVEVHSNGDS